jgi:hypothetical protein
LTMKLMNMMKVPAILPLLLTCHTVNYTPELKMHIKKLHIFT